MSSEFQMIGCAHCGNVFGTHHDTVKVFEREPDAKEGLFVQVNGTDRNPKDLKVPTIIQSKDMTGNPSMRRQGLIVEFWCEACNKRSSLCLVQHKGITQLYVEKIEP